MNSCSSFEHIAAKKEWFKRAVDQKSETAGDTTASRALKMGVFRAASVCVRERQEFQEENKEQYVSKKAIDAL